MTFPYFTLANIILGLFGAIFGTFPWFYVRTLGRIGRFRKVERQLLAFSALGKDGQLTDRSLILELLGEDNTKREEVARLEVQGGLMFETTKGLTQWIMGYDSNGKNLGHIDIQEQWNNLRSNSDRFRNRIAFAFIFLGYFVQILGLGLGSM